MIDLSEKHDFVKFIVKHELINGVHMYEFFKLLVRNKHLLEKIDFSSGSSKRKYKYNLIVNLRNDIFIFEVNGKRYNNKALFRSIPKLLEIVSLDSVCISVMDHQHMIKTRLEKVCHSLRMVENVIMDAFLDFVTQNERKKILLVKIDESLDNKDIEKFKTLSIEYSKL